MTGASAGMGLAFCEHYASRGADIVLIARRQGRLEEAAQKLEKDHGVNAYVLSLDLSSGDAPEQTVVFLANHNLSIDILVNNAGFTISNRFTDTGWDRQQAMAMAMIINVAGLCHALLPGMLERDWGRVINVASNLAWAPAGIGHTQYPASKAYVMRLSQALFQETKGTGVHVTAACPGSTKTEFQTANNIESSASDMPGFMVQTPKQVVSSSVRANEAGRSVHVPGWHNKLMVAGFQLIPDTWMLPFIRRSFK